MTREEAIYILERFIVYGERQKEALNLAIEALEAEPKHGRWIDVGKGYECSECGIVRAKGATGKYFYCPNCGLRMDEVEE